MKHLLLMATLLVNLLVTPLITPSIFLSPLLAAEIETQRVPVLAQVSHPHRYYWREMYMPQLTSGPSAVSYSPGGDELIYSMQGSLWRQAITADTAYQLTAGPGYDYQPDWSPDGRKVIFTRQQNNALSLMLLDLDSGKVSALTKGDAIHVEPRWSPDGKRIAFVSSQQGGYFGLYVGTVNADSLSAIQPLVVGHISQQDRYYYSETDHAINPSWSPDGKRIYYVSNDEVSWGSGDIWMIDVDDPQNRQKVLVEETTWSARPELAHDGKRLLYSSYAGRQWHQLWLTNTRGLSPLPLTFGEFDIKMARWSPDDRHIAYISNETGGLTLWQQTFVGGARKAITATQKVYKQPMTTLEIELVDDAGKALDGRVIVLASDQRHYAPAQSLIHADDYLDPATSPQENHYFYCAKKCELEIPRGQVSIRAMNGFSHTSDQAELNAKAQSQTVRLTLSRLELPPTFGNYISADLHVHMNYGGAYKQTLQGMGLQARGEDLDVIYNLLVNKEQRIPGISTFKTSADNIDGVTVYQAQEFHTSQWGHLSFLHLDDHFLTPDFASYRHTALASPYPSNGVMIDLAHQQNAIAGYVHPYDNAPDPDATGRLSHSLPLDVIQGRVDFLEVISFANHFEVAKVWYKLLNLGYRLPAGAGTDAMTNYASLRGPVGLNRAFLQADANDPASLKKAIKQGNSFVTNGPQVGLLAKTSSGTQYLGAGEIIKLPSEGGTLDVQLALRSYVPVSRLEVVQNGQVIHQVSLNEAALEADEKLQIPVKESGWILLRAINESPHPLVQDLYTYATTNPIWIELENKPAPVDQNDVEYFVRWLEKIREHVENSSDDFNATWENEFVLADLEQAMTKLKEKIK